MKKTTILIADDHAIVRMGLKSLLNSTHRFAVVGEAENGDIAIKLARKLSPDIIVMDLMMPCMDGAAATVEIMRERQESKILMLTTFGSFNGIARALDAGAAGAILKNTANDELIDALDRIASGERQVLSPEIQRLLKDDPPTPELSHRQQEALDMIVTGKTNAEIAYALNIREDSVKKLITATFEKIGATNRANAVDIAHRKHLIRNDPTQKENHKHP